MSKVTVISVEPNPPDAMCNPLLKWRARFTSPELGIFYLPFEQHSDAAACTEHVREHGTLPLMNQRGKIIPTDPVLFACPWCGQMTPCSHGPCADCLNDQQACS